MVKIFIKPDLYIKLFEYAKSVNHEISGLGAIKYNPDTHIINIEDIYLLRQRSTVGDTEIQPDAIAQLLLDPNIDPSTIKFWWHSHGNLGVFWSQQDESCINGLGQSMDWLVSLVIDRKHHYRLRLDIFRPQRITMDNLTLYIPFNIDKKQLLAEVRSKVNDIGYHNTNTWNNYNIVQQKQYSVDRFARFHEYLSCFQQHCPMCFMPISNNQLYCIKCGHKLI